MRKNFNKVFFSLPKTSFVLSNCSFFRGVVLYARLLLVSVLWKLRGNFSKQYRFCFKDVYFTYNLRDNTDIAALLEIYGDDEYKWDSLVSPKYILDLGANYGDTSVYFAIKYPEAMIIAVEPSPDSFERLKAHASQFQNIVPVHAALAESDGEIDLHLMPGSSLGHSIKKRSAVSEIVSVPAFTLRTLLNKHHITGECLVKFDIEGGEQTLFKQLGDCSKIDALIGEVHYDLIDMTESDVITALENFSLEVQNLSQKDRVIIRAHRIS